MAKFNAGDQIMICFYSDHWDGPYEATRMVNKKRSYMYRPDSIVPGNRYVEYISRPAREEECFYCKGTGDVPNDAAGILESCEHCKGSGSLPISAMLAYVTNRSDKVVSLEHYNAVVKPAIDAVKANREKGINARNERVKNHIQTLVKTILEADDPEYAAAEYLKKWGYAYNSKETYWKQSEIYEAASDYTSRHAKAS